MATFRTLSPALWSDPFIEGLSAQEKLLYIYLFTNEHVNNVGYMQATLRKISFETAVPQDAVAVFLEKTDRLGKTVRDGDSILCLNFVRHQTTKSPKVVQNLCKVFNLVGSAKLQRALLARYPDVFKNADTVPDPLPEDTDTVSTPYPNGADTVGKQLQDRVGHGIEKKDPEHTHTESHDLYAQPNQQDVCVSGPARYSQEDMMEAGDSVRREAGAIRQEFEELRNAYKAVRDDGPNAGWPEYQQARFSKGWPGLIFVLDRLQTLIEQDAQWKRGYKEGLRKFLINRMWEMEPRKEAGQDGQRETDEEKARREDFLARQKAYLDGLKAQKEAAKRK